MGPSEKRVGHGSANRTRAVSVRSIEQITIESAQSLVLGLMVVGFHSALSMGARIGSEWSCE